jgi:hypothetical protein
MKLPLATSLKNRDSTTDKDARVLNGYVEIKRNQKDQKKIESLRVLKRPALDSAFELSAGTGQVLYVPSTDDGDGEPGVVIGDLLTRAPTPITKLLSFFVQPSQSNLNTAISPAVVVRAINAIGQVATSFSGNVTMALSTNPTGATLGGTVTVAAASGVATFNNLTLNRSGENFRLRASSANLKSATSQTFDIPTKLVFTVQPSGGQAGVTLDPVEVTVQDLAGNTDTNYNGNVTIALYSSTGGVLSGTTTVQATNGIVSFTNLEISADGTYQFVVTAESVSTAYPPSRGVSNSFSLGNYTLIAGQTVLLGSTITGFNSGLGLGTTLLTSAAVYQQSLGVTNWQWAGTQLMTTADTYSVVIA